MKEIPESVIKYLNKFELPEWELIKNDTRNYKLIIVIPAVKESENIIKLLISLSENDNTYFNKTLIVFAVNSVINSPQDIVEDNNNTISYLNSIINKTPSRDKIANKISCSGLNIGVVDINSRDKQMSPKDGGVGLARKIGMDLSLKSFDYSDSSKNILVCLDADCTVQNNYITEIYNFFNTQKCSAAYVQFEHLLEQNVENKLAIICYEIFLRYYVLGLNIAGSPFAFHTIGSTMACDSESYIKAQGMNKRKAAEDFYFMEKLSKNTKIHKIINTKVYPSSRGSWRVPFGTGQRVNRYLSKQQNEYLLYSPESFYVLKSWLNYFHNPEILSSNEYLNFAKSIHIELYNFLVQNNFEDSWNKIIQNTKTAGQINLQKTFWFDGFRTLKFIHHLRDKVLPMVNMFEALDEVLAKFYDFKIKRGDEIIPNFEIQLEYLEILRKIA
ncbi:MAG: hypothetical protein KJ571_16295 [Bacteroidetes bacterium]|nr:hypothetical protein [Bacteroidota bacterium]